MPVTRSENETVPTSCPNDHTATIFDLPLFLREQIYDYIFFARIITINVDDTRHNGSRVLCRDRWQVYPDRTVPCPTLAIAQTCASLRAEALPRFYKKVMLQITASKHGSQWFFNGSPMTVHNNVEDDPETIEHDDDRIMRPRFDMMGESLKLLSYVHISIYCLPSIGWNVRSWTWSETLHTKFPRLQKLRVGVEVSSCTFDRVPLIDDFSLAAERDQGLSPQYYKDASTMSNGEFMRRLFDSTPRRFMMDFDVDITDGCATGGTTNIVLSPDQEPRFRLVNWFNFRPMNRGLVELLNDYGLRGEADTMREKILDNEATSVRWSFDGQ